MGFVIAVAVLCFVAGILIAVGFGLGALFGSMLWERALNWAQHKHRRDRRALVHITNNLRDALAADRSEGVAVVARRGEGEEWKDGGYDHD